MTAPVTKLSTSSSLVSVNSASSSALNSALSVHSVSVVTEQPMTQPSSNASISSPNNPVSANGSKENVSLALVSHSVEVQSNAGLNDDGSDQGQVHTTEIQLLASSNNEESQTSWARYLSLFSGCFNRENTEIQAVPVSDSDGAEPEGAEQEGTVVEQVAVVQEEASNSCMENLYIARLTAGARVVAETGTAAGARIAAGARNAFASYIHMPATQELSCAEGTSLCLNEAYDRMLDCFCYLCQDRSDQYQGVLRDDSEQIRINLNPIPKSRTYSLNQASQLSFIKVAEFSAENEQAAKEDENQEAQTSKPIPATDADFTASGVGSGTANATSVNATEKVKELPKLTSWEYDSDLSTDEDTNDKPESKSTSMSTLSPAEQVSSDIPYVLFEIIGTSLYSGLNVKLQLNKNAPIKCRRLTQEELGNAVEDNKAADQDVVKTPAGYCGRAINLYCYDHNCFPRELFVIESHNPQDPLIILPIIVRGAYLKDFKLEGIADLTTDE